MGVLLDLPPEILVAIASYLHFTDLFSLQRTCRTVSRVIPGDSESSSLRYQSELQIAGMQDNPHCVLPIKTRLDMLRARERAWASFDYPFLTNLKVPHKTSGYYDVTPGVFLMGKEDLDSTTRSIQAVQLPHQADTQAEWEVIPFDAKVVDFGTSIEENDLLASVCLTPIHDIPDMSRLCVILRRYSTHALYDGIASPIILLSEEPTHRDHPVISIEISGENLAVIVLFMDDDSDALMYVCNWKTGTRTAKMDPISVANTGLVFLREDILLHPQTNNNTLDIYHIPSSSSEDVLCIQKLQFPLFSPGYAISLIACRGDPSPTANGAFPKNTAHHRPYANNPEDAIIVFTFQISREDDDDDGEEQSASQFVLVVHRKALLELLPADSSTPSEGPGVPWEVWGPPITRWLRVNRFSINFITLSAGQRFIDFRSNLIWTENYDDRPDEIHILDFNPWHVKLAQARGSPESKKATTKVIGGCHASGHPTQPATSSAEQDARGQPDTVTTHDNNLDAEHPENVCPHGDAFANDVVSRLPFVLCSSAEIWKAYDSVLIDEERLLGLKAGYVDDFYQLHSMDLLYFG